MGMSIEEAIKHCEEVANSMTAQGECKECADEHRQLAEWLGKLEKVEQIIKEHDADRMPEDYWYIDRIRKVLEDE